VDIRTTERAEQLAQTVHSAKTLGVWRRFRAGSNQWVCWVDISIVCSLVTIRVHLGGRCRFDERKEQCMDPKHEQATNDPSLGRSRGSKKSEPNPQAEMKIHKAEDDVLNVIESVESQLGALRNAHEIHRKAMADLNKRKRDLEEQGNEIEIRESELSVREVELAEMRQDFESREQNLIQRASGLEQRESKIASQAEMLEQQEAELESKGVQLEQKIDELDRQLAGLSKRKAELKAVEQEVKAKLAIEDESAKKLKAAIKELEATKASFGEMSVQVESLNAELAEMRTLHEGTLGELKATESKLRGRVIELSERSHTLEELAEKAGSFEFDLNATREQYSKQLDEITKQLAREQKVSDGLRAQVEKSEQDRIEIVSESSAKIDALGEQLGKATSEIESMRKAAKDIGAQREGRFGELSKELEQSRKQVQTLNGQLNELAKAADEELTGEHERVARLESQIKELTGQLAKDSAKSASLQSQIEASPKVDPKAIAALQGQLAESQEAKSQSASKLEEALAAMGKLESEIAARDELIVEADARLQSLESQSSELIATVERLNTELGEAQSAPKVDADDWNQHRRSRLKKMRRILTGDAEKIRLATEALRSRYDQCEQVLTKRAELAQAYEVIVSAQRKYQTREVRSGVFVGLIGIAAITLVLGATSWFVSGRVSPGLYAAKVTLAASSGNATLSEAEMKQWERYITELTTDPRFLEVASERMKRRGISEFGVPGNLGAEMKKSLDVVSAMPGTVVMEYRGDGSARTERVLDTFAVALTSAANNARARRADSAMTTIEEPARSGSDPLDTRRIEAAGMIFGSGLLVTIIVGGVFWKKLSAAKSKFENDSRIEGLFDDSRWQQPG